MSSGRVLSRADGKSSNSPALRNLMASGAVSPLTGQEYCVALGGSPQMEVLCDQAAVLTTELQGGVPYWDASGGNTWDGKLSSHESTVNFFPPPANTNLRAWKNKIVNEAEGWSGWSCQNHPTEPSRVKLRSIPYQFLNRLTNPFVISANCCKEAVRRFINNELGSRLEWKNVCNSGEPRASWKGASTGGVTEQDFRRRDKVDGQIKEALKEVERLVELLPTPPVESRYRNCTQVLERESPQNGFTTKAPYSYFSPGGSDSLTPQQRDGLTKGLQNLGWKDPLGITSLLFNVPTKIRVKGFEIRNACGKNLGTLCSNIANMLKKLPGWLCELAASDRFRLFTAPKFLAPLLRAEAFLDEHSTCQAAVNSAVHPMDMTGVYVPETNSFECHPNEALHPKFYDIVRKYIERSLSGH